MIDEEDFLKPKPKDGFVPRPLDPLSVEELQAYLVFLDAEKARAHDEIDRRQHSRSRAEQFFVKT